MSKVALLIIDMQKGLQEEVTCKAAFDQAVMYINEISRFFREKELPVVIVQDLEVGGAGSDSFECVENLLVADSDYRIQKKFNNAFWETELDELLKGEDVDAVVTASIRSRVFDLMDAVAAGQSEQALQMLDDMLYKREPEQKIFYMISKQTGKLYQLKNMQKGLMIDVKASRLDMNPYALSKMEKLAQRFSAVALGRFVEKCMEMDLAVKKGQIKMRLALELLITSLGK